MDPVKNILGTAKVKPTKKVTMKNGKWVNVPVTKKDTLTINVVSDEYGRCPKCGQGYPNRQKVDNWWKCYNPKCKVGYYEPETGQVELE